MTPSLKQAAPSLRHKLAQQKWLTLIGLPVLLFAVFNNIYSVWGLLFVYWGVTSVISGQVFLLELIERRQDPALFWIIVALWIGSGALYVVADFFPAVLFF
ncbi:MAG: hypothetical protein AAF530_23060 [Pseudomonadota bacterium]